jgi:uncharacterized membrane protein (UPF0127 family)
VARFRGRPLLAVLAVALGLLGTAGAAPVRADTLTIVTGTGTHRLNVEIAANEDSRELGLMFRRSLAPDAGMLFEFDKDQPVAMWMKNTYVSLDMVFISTDGHVVNIERNTTPESLDVIQSNGPVRAVLEVAAGTADRLGIAPGAQVRHPFFEHHNVATRP